MLHYPGFSRRQIHWFSQAKLIKPPTGKGKGSYYDNEQLRTLQEIKALQDKGLKPSVIKAKLKSQIPNIMTQHEIIPGLIVYLDSTLKQRNPDVVKNIKRILDLSGLFNNESHAIQTARTITREKIEIVPDDELGERRIPKRVTQFEIIPGLVVYLDSSLDKKIPEIIKIIQLVLNLAGLLKDEPGE